LYNLIDFIFLPLCHARYGGIPVQRTLSFQLLVFKSSALPRRRLYISNNRANRKNAKFEGFCVNFALFDGGIRVIMDTAAKKGVFWVIMTRFLFMYHRNGRRILPRTIILRNLSAACVFVSLFYSLFHCFFYRLIHIIQNQLLQLFHSPFR